MFTVCIIRVFSYCGQLIVRAFTTIMGMVIKLNASELIIKQEKIIQSNINLIGNEVLEILRFINGFCLSPLGEDLLFELRVVLNELIVNAVIHGNKKDASKQVKISYGITRTRSLFFAVEDDGEGYDYRCHLDKGDEGARKIACENLEHCGRGMLLVKGLCEKVEFNKKGNRVLVVKKLF